MNFTGIQGFHDREDAGRRLAAKLASYSSDRDAVILALPRGGVPVAAEIAASLHRPFDVLVVRKLGVPGHEEYAMGAIAGDGVMVLDQRVLKQLGIRPAQVDAVIERETRELERREQLFRGGHPPPAVAGRTVILVDDGVATGSTMSAAIELLRHQQAARIVVAVPVAPPDTAARLRREADEVVTLLEPENFLAVGRWYQDFTQTTDEEVRALLAGDCPQHDTPPAADHPALEIIRRHAHPLHGYADDYDALLAMIGEAPIVMIGEASHGTHEFYRERARITQRLIVEKGFNAVAAEADWPDACRINRYVRRESADLDSIDALAGFDRFPAWMWRNADMLDFVGWLRDHNENVECRENQTGFYGLDLYSLHKSMNEVIAYLERKDPLEAAKARARYGCIGRFGGDPQNYGLLAGSGASESCRNEVIQQLTSLRHKEVDYIARNGAGAADEHFIAEQNARLVKNAEQYYRQMFRSDISSWNLRDEHMLDMLVNLLAHLQSRNGHAKVVVWAHNSHLGDASATEMSWRGEWNLGQLARQAFPGKCRLIGMTTHAGTVTAAAGWHLPAERKRVRPALDGSFEKLFHQAGLPAFMLDFTRQPVLADALDHPRIERAIGVVYRPESERHSHYFEARLPQQFDAVLHFDQTRAVEPLERTPHWQAGDAPETYPVGL